MRITTKQKTATSTEVVDNFNSTHSCYRVYPTCIEKGLYGVILINKDNLPLKENEMFVVEEVAATTLGYKKGGTTMQTFDIPQELFEGKNE